MPTKQFANKAGERPWGYYTYAYLRADGSPWYIGKGKGNRAWRPHGGKKRWSPPENDRILFLKWGLTDEESIRHEVYLISIFGLERDGGILSGNQTFGGEGVAGFVQPEELKQLQREIQTKRQLEAPDEHVIQAAARWGFDLGDWLRIDKKSRMRLMAALRRGTERELVLRAIKSGVDLRMVRTADACQFTDLVAWASKTQRERDIAVRRFALGVRGDALFDRRRVPTDTSAESYKARTQKIADAKLAASAKRYGVPFAIWSAWSRTQRLKFAKRLGRGWSVAEALAGMGSK